MYGSLFVSDYVPKGLPVVREVPTGFQTKAELLKGTEEQFRLWYSEFVNRPRQADEIRLPMPHPRQKTIIYARKRFKVMVCGRRFGKTTAALIAAVLRATSKPNQVIYYVAPTYRQAKQIAWGMLLDFIGNAYKRKNEQELVIEFANGSKIHLKGAENPDALRGAYVHLAILDEYQDQRPVVWEQIIQPMIADTQGDVWFIGTPKGFNHFQKLWKDAHDGKLGSDWAAYRLTTYDNPHIPRAEIERARKTTDERSFNQEYLAHFVQFSGLVYPQFERQKHVRFFDHKKVEGIYLTGIDVGADHPTAAVFTKITSGGSVYVWNEHYQADAAVAEHADAMLKIRESGVHVRKWYIDPSAKQFAKDLRTHGISTTPAVNDRRYGISELRALLEQGKLVIHPRCSNLIYEFEHHIYKDSKKSDKERGDVDKEVRKVDDDALDALRYAVASHFKGRTFNDLEVDPPMDVPPGVKTSFDKDTLRRYTVGNTPSNAPHFVAPEFQHLEA